jgi:hypothetical protein
VVVHDKGIGSGPPPLRGTILGGKMDRREFLIGLGAVMIALPAASTFQGCGSNSSSDNAASVTAFSVASSIVFNHSHNVTIPFADLTNPPSGGVTYVSDGDSHQHQIFLTEQQLADISRGRTDTVTSTVVNNHTHDWTITKRAA